MAFELITSWDDGNKLDIKLAKLLRTYSISAIFFIPNNCQLSPSEIRSLSTDFIIGGHTKTHPEDLKKLSFAEQAEEIAFNRGWLRGILRGLSADKLEWFCYPSGRYNDDTVEVVKLCGYKFARTVVTMSTDDYRSDPYRIKTSIHILPTRKEYEGLNWLEVAKRKFNEAVSKAGVFHLWGHSDEIERHSEWENLEKLLKFIKKTL